LVTTVLMRKSTDLPVPIRVFYHNPGEELRRLIQLMVSRMLIGNGLMQMPRPRRKLWLSSKDLRKILVTKESMRKFTDLHLLTRAFSQHHGEGLRSPILMDPAVDSIGLTKSQQTKNL